MASTLLGSSRVNAEAMARSGHVVCGRATWRRSTATSWRSATTGDPRGLPPPTPSRSSALGACTGVKSTSAPSERNTPPKLRQNFGGVFRGSGAVSPLEHGHSERNSPLIRSMPGGRLLVAGLTLMEMGVARSGSPASEATIR
jgi:hypothetical protein